LPVARVPDQLPPGWYPEPNGVMQRFWDGREWTEHTAPFEAPYPESARAGRTYWSVLFAIIFLGAAAALILWPVHQDLAGSSVSCGGNAIHAVQIDPSSVDGAIPSTGDADLDTATTSLVEDAAQGCKNTGHDRLVMAFWLTIGGIVISLVINSREKRRV
jgi:hypothetical protein